MKNVFLIVQQIIKDALNS